MANSDTVQNNFDLDLNISEVEYQRAEFAAVVFHNVVEFYPFDAHVECEYTITKDIIPSNRDWIGLYKVGWMSLKDYVYYEWSPYPENYETGKDSKGHVLFHSHKLPGDDGEFYQFCYVSNSGQVRGASMPFQFRKPHADDFIEIEDDETDMLIIRSKTVVMEESLRQAEDDKKEFLSVKKLLESERDGLVDRLCIMEVEFNKIQVVAKDLKKNLEIGEEKVVQMNCETADLTLVHDELKAKLHDLEKEKEAMAIHLMRIENQLEMTIATMKKLQSEKNELEGKNQNLLEEREMFKNGYTSTESNNESHMLQIENLHTRIAESESFATSLNDECSKLRKLVADQKMQLVEQISSLQAEQEDMKLISIQLKNAEDKLEAIKENKSMIQIEMRTYEETQKKMSADLEEKEERCSELTHQIIRMKEGFIEESECLKSVISDLENQLTATKQVQEKCDVDIKLLRGQLDQKPVNSDISHGSMYALQTAQDKLKERFTKLQNVHQEKLTGNSRKLKHAHEREFTLVRELEDMKEHLRMGKEEYKTLYIEKQKLQKKLEKNMGKREIDNGTEELQQKLLDLGEELKQQQDRKEMYKKELQDEHSRQEILRKNYKEYMQKREKEIDRLRRTNEEVASGYETKIRILENYIADKDKTIEVLNQKLRDKVRLCDEPYSGPTTPKKTLSTVEVARCPIFEKPQLVIYPKIPMRSLQPTQCTQQESNINIPPLRYPEHGHFSDNELVYPDQEIPDANDSLHELLTLAAPIKPVVLPSAKLAAVKAAISGPPSEDDDMGMIFDREVKVSLNDGVTGPIVPPLARPQLQTEERYMDAIGEPMKQCPVCGMTFSADTVEKYVTEHILGHAGRICPFCMKIEDDGMTNEDFEHHVYNHLQNVAENK